MMTKVETQRAGQTYEVVFKNGAKVILSNHHLSWGTTGTSGRKGPIFRVPGGRGAAWNAWGDNLDATGIEAIFLTN